MTPPDYSTWLTKAQAAAAIGVSTKAIERFTQAGKLEQAFRPQAGSPDVAVYEPTDVARIAAERRPAPPAPFVVPGGAPAPTNGNGHGPSSALTVATPSPFSNFDEARRAFVLGLSDFAGMLKTVSQTSETQTLFLTVEEAAALLNWTAREVRRAIRRGEVPCRFNEKRDWHTWRIRRKDLEQL